MCTRHILIIMALLALAVPAPTAQAGGVVTVCDEAHLLAALAGGGTVAPKAVLGFLLAALLGMGACCRRHQLS